MPSTIVLPAIISDHMVVQAGRPATIWGWASPGERIRVELAGNTSVTVADRDGNFSTQLQIAKAGGPYLLRISGRTERIIENVLVGDVWLAAGQSNMEWWTAHATDSEREIPAACHPRIRLFHVPACATKQRRDDGDGRWVECDPQTVRDFSAVAYFFGRDLHRSTGRPIGLINTSWGGTRIEPWISLSGLRSSRRFEGLVRSHRASLSGQPRAEECGFYRDTGPTGTARGWANREHDDAGWKTMPVPGCWNTHGVDRVGAVWFRRTVTLPRSWVGQDLRMDLGPLVDFDIAFVNGEQVGGLDRGTNGAWNIPRTYAIPAGLMSVGKNTIAVRIFAHGTNGGFAGTAEQLRLSVVNDRRPRRIPLAGRWRYRIERGLKQLGAASRGTVPGTIFHAMIAPIVRSTIRGVLWYQGESNVEDAADYRALLTLLIRDWRRQWGEPHLPFYIVQLSDYPRSPVDDRLPRLREAQTLVAAGPDSGLVVTLDGGERDIHARDKRTVGRRLALVALADSYGRRVEYSGPVYAGCDIVGKRLRLRFEHAGRTLTTSDGRSPGDFVIAGVDRVFVPARSEIHGDSVLVWSARVPRPVAVRYAWSDTPRCTLRNAAGLPASPFRTDRWP
ncbi:MAG: 9-O-acetylesterase [Planctomycetes bacterium]|nr:9-O-acetylesterase [Planctomycetota bacterium]